MRPNSRMSAAEARELGSGEGETVTTSGKNSAGLYKFVRPLASLSATMLYLAEAGSDRLTINQAAFFLIAAAADAKGAPLTVSEIMEGAADILNPSVANTYKVLLEPRASSHGGSSLGWLTREPDPDDERRKYLRLTPKGAAVIKAALLALGQTTYKDDNDGPAST